MTIQARFMAKVQPVPSGCWEWIAARMPAGYGWFGWSKTDRTYAHRASFRLFRGEIPEGMEVHHRCHNPGCANPDHLDLVTPRENKRLQTGIRRGPYRVGSECRHGHERSLENTAVNSRGSRICRPCHRMAVQRCRAAGG